MKAIQLNAVKISFSIANTINSVQITKKESLSFAAPNFPKIFRRRTKLGVPPNSVQRLMFSMVIKSFFIKNSLSFAKKKNQIKNNIGRECLTEFPTRKFPTKFIGLAKLREETSYQKKNLGGGLRNYKTQPKKLLGKKNFAPSVSLYTEGAFFYGKHFPFYFGAYKKIPVGLNLLDQSPNLVAYGIHPGSFAEPKKNLKYNLPNYGRSNQDTCMFNKPAVFEGQWVQSGDLLADGAASVGGELSLGQNLLIAYMPWEGYNYEDAILVSERLVMDDLYTSIHIERYEMEIKETKLGAEEITRQIPDINDKEIQHLDNKGVVKIGSWVEEGDILVGKVTPINKKSISPYQKLLYTILEKQFLPTIDSSLRAPKGIKAKVIDIKLFDFSSAKTNKISTNKNQKFKKKNFTELKELDQIDQRQLKIKHTLNQKKKNFPVLFANHYGKKNFLPKAPYKFFMVEKNCLNSLKLFTQPSRIRIRDYRGRPNKFSNEAQRPFLKRISLKNSNNKRLTKLREGTPSNLFGTPPYCVTPKISFLRTIPKFYSTINKNAVPYYKYYFPKKIKIKIKKVPQNQNNTVYKLREGVGNSENFKDLKKFYSPPPGERRYAVSQVTPRLKFAKNFLNFLNQITVHRQFMNKSLAFLFYTFNVLGSYPKNRVAKKFLKQNRALRQYFYNNKFVVKVLKQKNIRSHAVGRTTLGVGGFHPYKNKKRVRSLPLRSLSFATNSPKKFRGGSFAAINLQINRKINDFSSANGFSVPPIKLKKNKELFPIKKGTKKYGSETKRVGNLERLKSTFSSFSFFKKNDFFSVSEAKRGDSKNSRRLCSTPYIYAKKNFLHNQSLNLSTTAKILPEKTFKGSFAEKSTAKKKFGGGLRDSRPLSFANNEVSSFSFAKKFIQKVHIYLAEKRKIQVGDKMAGRHGNKGIISQILPMEDMPYLPDGTPIDMVLNPLGVPSRMNVGQIYECLLGLAGKYLGENFKVFPFDETYGPEASRSWVFSKLYEASLKTRQNWLFDPNSPGKMRLYDGRTGECFHQPITVGYAYMLKLVHMVDDKIHARSTGPYSLVTQQPLRGRSKQGGQRLGEMEVWALEGYGAAFILLEMLTIKSDDMTGRMTLWSNLILNKNLKIGTPESFKVLICELQALCLDIGLYRFNPLRVSPEQVSQNSLDLQSYNLKNSINVNNGTGHPNQHSLNKVDPTLKIEEQRLQHRSIPEFNKKYTNKDLTLVEIDSLMNLP
nr:beta subunit of RNA polymerase protein b [Borodinellopsis texensis]